MGCEEECWQQPELDQLRDENARLQELLQRALQEHVTDTRSLVAEIDRLREERANCAAEVVRLQVMLKALQEESQKATMEFVKVAAIAEAEIARLHGELQACGLDNEAYFNRCEEQAGEIKQLRGELELERKRLTTSEALRTGLIEVLDRHERALDRYRYAVVFAAAEAWDGAIDMRARFGWARALDRKEISDDEIAAIGKQYLDWEDGR